MIESARKHYFALVILTLLFAFAFIGYYVINTSKTQVFRFGPFAIGSRGDSTQVVTLANGYHIDHVETVTSEADQEKGLGGRKKLSDREGMLFLFLNGRKPGSFWMKDMNVSIDIVWLDCQGKVLSINKSVNPESYPKKYPPPSGAMFVLEVQAGLSERESIKSGDQLVFSTDARGGSWMGCGESPKSK